MDNLPDVLQSRSDVETVLDRLQDLNQFGIHLGGEWRSNICCRCGASTQGFSEGCGYDNLCQTCLWGAPYCYANPRGETEFYTNQTVFVSQPYTGYSSLRTIWNGVVSDGATYVQIFGIVKVDGQPWLLRATENGIAHTCDVHYLDGQMFQMYGLCLIGYKEMIRLLGTQRPL